MIGKTVSHYKIIEKLGEGGMGEIYLAEDLKLERKVAIKFLPQHLNRDKDNVVRFIQEAKAAAPLNHSNIIAIYEIAEEDDRIFIVMEYVEGQSLRELIIAHKELPFDLCIDIITQISEGLSKAHKAGIIHRDIKPENVMIERDGRVKILDFGLAKLKGMSKLTKESSILGTVQYMSPEQFWGESIDLKTDIWSLGVVLYEMLTGQIPFNGKVDQAIVYSISKEKYKPLSNLRGDIPKKLERIVDQSLEKDPKKRYQHVEEMLKDLRSVKGTEIQETDSKKQASRKRSGMIVGKKRRSKPDL